jgi:hypothetical protein
MQNQRRTQSITLDYAKATNTIKTGVSQTNAKNQGQKRGAATQPSTKEPKTITETTYKTIVPKQLCNEFDNEIEDAMLAAIKLPEGNKHTTPMKEPKGQDNKNLESYTGAVSKTAEQNPNSNQTNNAANQTIKNPYKKATAIQDARIEALECKFAKLRKELTATNIYLFIPIFILTAIQ